ncbi:MAG TPA: twin-arginine translocase subunit TatC [Candidatus Limnocylindrales bacterium]|jgi:sec-independent protein translocase protein TatC|nr:twin-arginine translocase subunit TatC [Candidatus Limnocylindrales bacterium]
MADADALLEPGVGGVPATPDPTPATPPAAPPADESIMSLVDHLGELRSRLFKALIAIGVGSVIGYLVAVPVRNFLILPLGGRTLQVLGMGDAFMIQIKISLVIGIILAMPVLLYQVWAFVAPGLTPNERRTIRPWIPLALLFFAIGVAIAYFILPFAIAFLFSYTDDVLVAQPAAGPYFDFVTTLFLVFGLIMEFPILLVGLSKVGIVTSERLSGSRRMIILGIAIFAAVVTPGGDVVSPIVLGTTMYILFELTALFIRRSGR